MRPSYKELAKKASISPHEIEELVTDPVIRDSIIRLKMDILVSGWVVKGSSDAVVLFSRHILSRIWVELMSLLLDAVAKGTQCLEISWDMEDVKILGRSYPASIIPKNFYNIPLGTYKFLWDEKKRSIVGVSYTDQDGNKKAIMEEKVLWYAFSPTERSWPYGVPLLEKVRPYHEMFTDAMDLLGAYVENLTMPPIVGYAPPGEIRDYRTGDVVDGLEYLLNRLKELRANGISVLPTDLTPEGQNKWRIDFQSGATPAGSVEIARILEILRQFKREAVYNTTREQAGGGLMGGTTVQTSGLAGFVFREVLNAINKQLLHYLIYLNWGPEEWAYIEPADQGVDVGLVRDIVRSTIQFSEPDRKRILELLDWYSLLQMFGMPIALEESEEPEIPQAGLGGMGFPGLTGLGGLPLGGGFQIPPSINLPTGLELPAPEQPSEDTEAMKALEATLEK